MGWVRVRVCFDPLKVTIFHSELLLDNIIQDERLVSKMDGKTKARLSGTGIVECLEIIDVGCNVKQFDGLT